MICRGETQGKKKPAVVAGFFVKPVQQECLINYLILPSL
ncbi:hypothetical protein SAMN05216255_2799 [Pseudomonas segetis]|uniref:Uncharacterized protein n=1 Tax=Pseudomonas segetis TaxID=298908 RepID=A0A239FVM4_9PSED|nr:hypothetical protein SAMN05216255_2799 [Pseudomonas segetis]